MTQTRKVCIFFTQFIPLPEVGDELAEEDWEVVVDEEGGGAVLPH